MNPTQGLGRVPGCLNARVESSRSSTVRVRRPASKCCSTASARPNSSSLSHGRYTCNIHMSAIDGIDYRPLRRVACTLRKASSKTVLARMIGSGPSAQITRQILQRFDECSRLKGVLFQPRHSPVLRLFRVRIRSIPGVDVVSSGPDGRLVHAECRAGWWWANRVDGFVMV